jgi:hypothetical protein
LNIFFFLFTFNRCKLCARTLLFSRQVLERHLSHQHNELYADYCERYLTTPGPPDSSQPVKTEMEETNNSCVRIQIPLLDPSAENGLLPPPKSEPAEGEHGGNSAARVKDDAWGWRLDSAVEYDEPELKGPGYQCPLPGCTFKTDLEVGLRGLRSMFQISFIEQDLDKVLIRIWVMFSILVP